MDEPAWARVDYPKIDFQDLYYYAAPKTASGPKSLEEVDPELLEILSRSSASLARRAGSAGRRRRREAQRRVAVDAVFDSVSVVTTFKKELAKRRRHLLPDLRGGAHAPRAREEVPRLASCRHRTTTMRRLNSAVFSDGSFVYIPKGVRCPMELSTYFRINEAEHRANSSAP